MLGVRQLILFCTLGPCVAGLGCLALYIEMIKLVYSRIQILSRRSPKKKKFYQNTPMWGVRQLILFCTRGPCVAGLGCLALYTGSVLIWFL